MWIQETAEGKVLHLTSEDSKEVAELIERESLRIFKKNREAYRILAGKDSTRVEWNND